MELLNCPFCGNKVTEEHSILEHNSDCYFVIRNRALVKKEDLDQGVIDSAWNKRAN